MPPIGSQDDFSSDDQDILASLGLDHDEEGELQQATGEADSTASTGSSAQEPQTTPSQTEAADASAAAETPAEQDQHRASVNQALRASRRAERRAKEEAARERQAREEATRELEELRKKVPDQAQTGVQSDDEIAQLEEDFPEAAAIIKRERAARLEAERRASEAAGASPQQEAAPEFEPEAFPDEVQASIDQVPDLMAWQYDPARQQEFQLAKAADALLQQHPKWAGKPMHERFAEVVRRVKAELLDPSTQEQQPTGNSGRAVAAAKAASAQRPAPETLSDLGGGTTVSTASNLARYQAMKSDDDILAELDRG
jgi:hypothetical protein